MEFKGTKGKWRFDDLTLLVKACDDANPKYQTTIALVNSKVDYTPGKQTQFYNALLISKAPEMLEMLERLTNTIKNLDKTSLSYGVQNRLLKAAHLAEQLIHDATNA